ncbi:uncharacterized protein LOC110885324 isoform X3 [Helianthus annuus]|uniref:uncharacterized protein LOC110885324 isoform X3 n=1 Tax=Helianthus annuus TaxID=4232 RepID=UPI001652C230|nr:uncharacterized protein LOC110885324 isoform X3 [Helianthus annuus]
MDETVINAEEVRKEDEEVYEIIEAPKFVDFTKPYAFRTDDDRYWFCSRVGCDQKHEEEINHEEISKHFVFRVLAARSPNIKLTKTLYNEHSRIKCPLSAPAKPSKPKIPKLATNASLISHKNDDPKSKSRQVASKYMTPPSNKMNQPNHNSFLSVDDPQNKSGPRSKVGSAPVIRSRQVASRYMTTPRNKMSQPKHNSFLSVPNSKATDVDGPKSGTVAKGLVFRSPKKAITLEKSVELHTPVTKICEGTKRLEILTGSRSKPKKPEPEDSSRKLKIRKSEMNDLWNIEDKENTESPEDLSNVGGKENALNAQDNNRSNNQLFGNKIVSNEIQKKNKIVQTAGPAVIKCKKPKPTNIKPFRLRTDERGVLKEEKKFHFTVPEKEVAKDTCVKKQTYRVAKNEKSNTVLRRPESSQQRSSASLRTRSPSVQMPATRCNRELF